MLVRSERGGKKAPDRVDKDDGEVVTQQFNLYLPFEDIVIRFVREETVVCSTFGRTFQRNSKKLEVVTTLRDFHSRDIRQSSHPTIHRRWHSELILYVLPVDPL